MPNKETGTVNGASHGPESAQEKAQCEWIGAEALKPLLVPIASLVADPRNARVHPQRNLEAIVRSLGAFGQLKPVVVVDSVVRAGNGLVAAAQALGWTHVAAVPASLTPEEATAYGLADNKTSDLSEWNFEVVADLLKELPESLLDATGFEMDERNLLISADFKPTPMGDQSKLDSTAKVKCPQCGWEFSNGKADPQA